MWIDLADIHRTFYLKTILGPYTRPQNRALSPTFSPPRHTRWMTKRTHTEAKWVTSWSLTALTVGRVSLATDSLKGLQWLRLRKACKQSPCIAPLMQRHTASSASSHELKGHVCCSSQPLQWRGDTSTDPIERVARDFATEWPHCPVPLIAACSPQLRHTACHLSCNKISPFVAVSSKTLLVR